MRESLRNNDLVFYHYSLNKLPRLETKHFRGEVSKETFERAEKSYKKAYGVDNYFKHISLLFGQLPTNVASLFNGKHEIYTPGLVLYEHKVLLKSLSKGRWETLSSPEEIELLDNTPDDYDFDDPEKWDSYMRQLRDIKTKNGYFGQGREKLVSQHNRFSSKTEDFFAAMGKRKDDTVLRQYASTVPHLFFYPDSGYIEVTDVRKIKIN